MFPRSSAYTKFCEGARQPARAARNCAKLVAWSDGQDRRQVGRRNVAHPVDRRGLPRLRHDRPVHGDVHGQPHRRAATDRDRVVHLLHLPPRTAPVVLTRAGLAGLLCVEERGLVLRVGEGPGDVVVVPDEDAGQARHADPGDRSQARTAPPGTRRTGWSAASAGRRPAWTRRRRPPGRWPPTRCCPDSGAQRPRAGHSPGPGAPMRRLPRPRGW